MEIKKTLFSAIGMAIGLAAASAQAALIASDSFESYNTGALGSQGASGNGWLGSWTANNAVKVVAKSMTYSSGSISLSGGGQAAQADRTAADRLVGRDFTTQTSGTIYFSILVQPIGDLNNDLAFFGLQDKDGGTSPFGNAAGVDVGLNNSIGADVYAANGNRLSASTATSPANGTTYLLVGRINPVSGIYRSINVIVNPGSNDETTAFASATNVSYASNTANDLGRFIIRSANIDANEGFYFDRLVIGTDYTSVVPEPTSLALAACGIGALLARRRRA